MGVRRLAVANRPNIFQMLLVPDSAASDWTTGQAVDIDNNQLDGHDDRYVQGRWKIGDTSHKLAGYSINEARFGYIVNPNPTNSILVVNN